jgi:dihydrofolate reductase
MTTAKADVRRAISLEIIAAVAANGVIGRNGQLAWHLPDDLRHFKQLTMGHPMLMGRRTYESIGRPLPGRRTIVISTTLQETPHPDVEVAPSLDEARSLIADGTGSAFIIGGAVLYAAALPHVDVMHLTELDMPIEGDVMFPAFDRSQWRRVAAVPHDSDDRHAIPFTFSRYERIL